MEYRPEYNPKVIGRNLKRLRKKKGLSVQEVREYLRLGTPQAIYKYESGKGYPQADTLLALMYLYDADYHDIVDEHIDLVVDINLYIYEDKKIIRIKKYVNLLGEYYKKNRAV